MAITTENALNVTLSRYTEGLRIVSEAWVQTFQLDTTDDAALRVAALTGVTEIPAWDGSADLTQQVFDSAGATSISYVNKGVQVRIPRRLSQDIPTLVGDAARKLGVAVAATYKKMATASYDNAFTSLVTADGKALCAVDHATATTTRSNLITSALDYDSFYAMLAQARQWNSYQDLEYDLADMGWYLVTGPTNERKAREILGSAVSSDAMQFNAASTYNVEHIILNSLIDDDDWFLVSKAETPLIFWERSAPFLSQVIDQDNRAVKLNLEFATAQAVKPVPDGIFGSNVV